MFSIFPEVPVSVVTPLDDKVAITEETITFKCKLSKSGQPVKWLKDGKELKPNDKCQMSEDGQMYQLQVTDCNKNDAGKYSLVCGDEKTSASLEVKGSCSKTSKRLISFRCQHQNLSY